MTHDQKLPVNDSCGKWVPSGLPPGEFRGSQEAGSVMLEFVIAFPLILVLTFACIQFAQLWVARMVGQYAAYSAARSALVCANDEYASQGGPPARSAAQVCALLMQPWGAASERSVTTVGESPKWNVSATNVYTFSLVMPIVGQIIAWNMNPWADSTAWETPGKQSDNIDALGYPTIRLTNVVTLPKPYQTMVSSRL